MAKTVIGLTGPTGAGKSTWSAAFEELGCAIIDCDRIARHITDTPEVQEALQKQFGADIMQHENLDRRRLAACAFTDSASVKKLNAITHPAIRKVILRQLEQFTAEEQVRAVIIDAPLLFEGGLEECCTITAAVLAPQEKRLQRIIQRDGITKEEALKRIASQHGDSFFREHAGYILDGATQPEAVPAAAKKVLHIWLGEENI